MKYILSFLMVLAATLVVATAEAGNNENNPHVASVALGSLATDDTQLPALHLSKKSKIVSVKLMDGAGVSASDTNYVQVSLKDTSDDAEVAELDSRAAHENGLVLNVGKDLNVSDAELPAGTDLYVDYQEAGTVQLTNAVLLIEYYPY